MLSRNVAMRVENLGKAYTIFHNQVRARSLRDAITRRVRNPLRFTERERFWALTDINFEVPQGEVMGVIGRNGAGKSTLLKLLSRTSYPTTGRIEFYGRVGSLLEVGTGFHRELTGRENIFLNGSILGMPRAVVRERFDQIVDFAGTEKFLDTPVKRYSSGMYVRLAFAVAAHMQPEILIVDEVLAVGDITFQRKCLARMAELSREGRTVLFVSHNMGTISDLCTACIYLKNGQIEIEGPTEQVVQQYTTDIEEAAEMNLAEREDRKGEGDVKMTNLRFLDAESLEPLRNVVAGRPVLMELAYEGNSGVPSRLKHLSVWLDFYTLGGQFVTSVNSHVAQGEFGVVDRSGRLYCALPRFPLMRGPFVLNATMMLGNVLQDQVEHAARVDVDPGDYYNSGFPDTQDRQGVFVDQRWADNVDEAVGYTREPLRVADEVHYSVAG